MSGFSFGVTDNRTEWDRFNADMRKASVGKLYVAVGYPDDGSDHGDGLSNARLAAIHEFGAGVPERSFIRSTIDEKAEEIFARAARLGSAMLEGKGKVEAALGQLGAFVQAQIRNKVTRGAGLEPLAPSTVAAKGSSRPLIDTGQLIGALKWAVRKD